MKSLKAAVVIAGSLIVTGAAAPAFASSSADPMPVRNDRILPAQDVSALDTRLPTDALAIERENPLLGAVVDAMTAMKDSGSERRTLTQQS
ncbi:hypothetical protein [Streptomyces capillispiralis]|uniref:Uncharacterized protein n=1 Tax=Streptomyces capillispiralis TaxID=68182 RepID=A0A561TJW8_9ACTN|nr:hypothetical protein [Streptomyces capillispiralis]TWF87407.1 hypothetical protein FHX78_114415 [Streptomyces capillispiralis]GHH92669.1 hypothetical protein GCM10017779_31260 [Streptomyces capillispiralis]